MWFTATAINHHINPNSSISSCSLENSPILIDNLSSRCNFAPSTSATHIYLGAYRWRRCAFPSMGLGERIWKGPFQAGSDRSFIERDLAPSHTHTPCPPHLCLGHCHQAWYSWSTPHPTPSHPSKGLCHCKSFSRLKQCQTHTHTHTHTHIMCPFPKGSFRRALCLSECIEQVCADWERSTECKNGEKDLWHYLVLGRRVCVDIDSIPLEINPSGLKDTSPTQPLTSVYVCVCVQGGKGSAQTPTPR